MIALLTARGYLTPYAFACGYREVLRNGVTLWMEHGTYHVASVKRGRKAFRTLGAARAWAQKREEV